MIWKPRSPETIARSTLQVLRLDQHRSITLQAPSDVLPSSLVLDALAVRAKDLEQVFATTLEVILQRLAADRASHRLLAVLSREHNRFAGRTSVVVRKDQRALIQHT